MRTRLFLVYFVAIAFISGYYVIEGNAHKTGQTGNSRTGCGSGCHGSSSAGNTNTTVTIWTDAAELTVGTQYTFHITVANATNDFAGCDITVDNSAQLAVDGGVASGLKLLGTELTHTTPKQGDGDSVTWTFLYTPTKTGVSHIYAAGNAVNHNNREDAGDQWNRTTFTTTVVASSAPTIAVPTLVRDTALVGVTSSKAVWLKNSGASPLTVSSYSLKSGAAWSITGGGELTVPAGDSVSLTVNFLPTSKGTFVDTLHVTSNDAAKPVASIPLVGIGTQGQIQFDSTQIDFGQVKTGTNKQVSMIITNKGNGPLMITNISVVSASGAFSNITTPVFPLTLPKNSGKVTVTFQFAPTAATSDNAVATISFAEAVASRDTSIFLIGEGIVNARVSESASERELFVSPNPSNGIVTVHSESRIEEVIVTDAAGRTVTTVQPSEGRIDLTQVVSGTYFLNVRQPNGAVSVRRIVIER